MRVGKDYIRSIIKEELSKAEVRNMIDNKLSDYVKEREFKKQVRNIAVDIIDDFFHEMWRKNGFWKTPLKNK